MHYSKQSRFEGSDRQIRAAILKLITEKAAINKADIFRIINREENRMEKVLADLQSEYFIIKNDYELYVIV